MKVALDIKQDKRKTLYVGDLFTYSNTENVYMRIGNKEERCVVINGLRTGEVLPYSSEGIIFLKQVGKLELVRGD